MRDAKAKRYAQHLDELDEEGVTCRPLVWGTYGPPHPEAEETLQGLAGAAARRLGLGSSACPFPARAVRFRFSFGGERLAWRM
eukprot:12503730-Alexandrium_andersonii.AAC.1